MGTNVHLVYDSAFSTSFTSNGGSPFPDKGWRVVSSTATPETINVIVDREFYPSDCSRQGQTGCNGAYTTYSYNITFTDATGYTHTYDTSTDQPSVVCRPDSGICTNQNLIAGGVAHDGTGYTFVVNPTTPSPYAGVVIVTSPSGQTYTWTGSGTNIADPNGNSGVSNLTNSGTFTDDTNVTATVTGGAYNSTDYTKWTSRTPVQVQYTDTEGNFQTVTVTYGMHVVTYNCAYSGVPAYSQATGLVDSVTYPDGSGYQFTYQSDGNLQTMTLPTGGTITYAVGTLCGSSGNPNIQLGLPATLSRTTQDGTTTYTQTVTASNGEYPVNSTTTISKPDGSSEQISFIYAVSSSSENLNYETSHTWSSSSGAVLQSSMNCYNAATGDCTSSPIALPITQISTTTTRDGLSAKKITILNANSLPTETDVYDFGASSPTRKTVTQYASPAAGVVDRPSSVTVYDANNNKIAQTSFEYDGSGNRTYQHAWLNTTGKTLDTQWTYGTGGVPSAVQDPLGNSTSYQYDQEFNACLQAVLPPTPPSGASLATSGGCYLANLRAASTDANGNITTRSYDSMLRPTGSKTASAAGPLVAQTTVTYSGATLPETITTTISASPDPDQVSSVVLDGLGRVATTYAASGARVDTTYNSMGLIQSVSNPYFSTSDSTYGITSYLYDALGRRTGMCEPGSSASAVCTASTASQSWSYSGNTNTNQAVTLFTDESGNQWSRATDALGRLKTVPGAKWHITHPQHGNGLLV